MGEITHPTGVVCWVKSYITRWCGMGDFTHPAGLNAGVGWVISPIPLDYTPVQMYFISM